MSDQPKYEPDKFIVINRKHVEELDKFLDLHGAPALQRSTNILKTALSGFNGSLNLNLDKSTGHKYYVCNQDEPYADEVLKVILEGEKLKEYGKDVIIVTGVCQKCGKINCLLDSETMHCGDCAK